MRLRDRLKRAADLDGLYLADRAERRSLRPIIEAPRRPDIGATLAGRSVLIATGSQMATALALLGIDGLARRLVLLPPGFSDSQIAGVIADAEVDLCVTDAGSQVAPALDRLPRIATETAALSGGAAEPQATEWVLATSGTAGTPKLVVHTLEGLAGGINTAAAVEPGTVWGTFYDIRRYGGLQVYLRAMFGPAPLVLSDPHEPMRDFLDRVAQAGVTHILGTPSHWRLALMCGQSGLAPRYARLSGEIADQAILDMLRAALPEAKIAHAYASTESGVGFVVADGREGFPAGLVGRRPGIEIAIRDGAIHVRSERTGRRYLGANAPPLIDPAGFVDTGDLVERRGERFYFAGRRSGTVNVGGLKVQPEEVEAVINGHPRVSMSRVRARPSPILGAVVEADVVLAGDGMAAATDDAALRSAIIAHCRSQLARHKVPVNVRFVPDLPLSAGGKLLRSAS